MADSEQRGGKKTVQIAIKGIDADLWRAIRVEAARRDTSAARVVVMALAEWLERHQQK